MVDGATFGATLSRTHPSNWRPAPVKFRPMNDEPQTFRVLVRGPRQGWWWDHAQSVLKDPTERDEIPEAVLPVLARNEVRTSALSRGGGCSDSRLGRNAPWVGKKNPVSSSLRTRARPWSIGGSYRRSSPARTTVAPRGGDLLGQRSQKTTSSSVLAIHATVAGTTTERPRTVS